MTAARRAELALAGVTLIWGTSFTVVKGALEDCSTVAFLAMRFACATFAMAVFSRRAIADGQWRDAFSRRGGLIAGCLLAAAYLFQTTGLKFTSASHSAFLTALSIVLVPLAGALVHRQAPKRLEWLGAAAAISGVALMTMPGNGFRMGVGDLLSIGGAIVFTGHILATGWFAQRARLAGLNVTQFALAAVVFTVAAPMVEAPAARFTPRLLAALAVTSVLCTALAYTVQAWAQRNISPTRAALIFALEPVTAAATEWLVAGRVLPPSGLAGAALVLTGVLAAELKPVNRAA